LALAPRVAREIARLTNASIWTVASRALIRAWMRSPRYKWQGDIRFLSDRAGDMADLATRHPWLDAPAHALPGKAAHIALMITAQSYVEGLDPEAPIPTVAPLLAQPLVEACLGIPTWFWFKDGLNRAIAREAFRDDLPLPVQARRSKGTPGSFVAAIYEANRPIIRDLLLGGLLAQHGLIDRATLTQALKQPGPVRGFDYIRLMFLVDAEAWARSIEEAGATKSHMSPLRTFVR